MEIKTSLFLFLMEDNTAIHVIYLDKQKRFLQIANKYTQENVVIKNAYDQYDFVKTYTPICIEDVIPIEHFLDWNHHVKRYMKNFGIDNVRGGDYSHMELSMEEKELIQNELMDKSIFSLYPSQKKNQSMLDENVEYSSLKYIQLDDNKTLPLDRNVLQDLQWFLTYIQTPSIYQESDHKEGMLKKIKSIVALMPYLYKHTKKLPINETWTPTFIVEHSDHVFAPFTKPYIETMNPFYMEMIVSLLEHFIHLTCYCINRIDEAEFDVTIPSGSIYQYVSDYLSSSWETDN